MKSALILHIGLVLLFPLLAMAVERRPMTIADLFRFQRISDPQISPDGKQVVYMVTRVDLENNKTTSALWLVPVEAGEPRQLTNPGDGKKDKHPRWSPDGQRLLFESNRGGDNQLWLIDLAGGEARQLTSIATEAGNAIWSPDGKKIAFVSAVWPEYSAKPFKESNELNKKRKEEIEKSPVKAKVFTRLFYRHWDSYVDDKRQHLFVMEAPAHGLPPVGLEPRDITPGDRDAYPTSTTFSVGDDFTFSPDGKYLVFTAVPEKDEAWSTNYDLCRVPVAGGPVETLTKDNAAADGCPRFSPDGKFVIYRAQRRAGYEADRWELIGAEANPDGSFKTKPRSLTAKMDVSIEEYAWTKNNMILVAVEIEGSKRILALASDLTAVDIAPGGFPFYPGMQKPSNNEPAGASGSLSVSVATGKAAFTHARMDQPPEVLVHVGDQARNLSQANSKLLAELDLPRPESVEVPVEGGKMQMWVLKPPGFDPKKKWPLAYLVHGGPQGAWEDGWSYRWAPVLWSAQGYVVALPNPRGSTGFGQKFVDEISGDWGGKCYADLLQGLDHMEKQPYIDRDRLAAAGASFGGYMVNWFAVSTGKFKCLISHCSVWNFESMYATTDELWFDEWEHGGPPWGPKPKSYVEFSPHKKAGNLAKFKTPILVIHNDLDFRCPIGQGHELFTTLQRQRVPSKLINFPDEGHWVQKPKNSEYWHKEVFAWLTKYCPPGGR